MVDERKSAPEPSQQVGDSSGVPLAAEQGQVQETVDYTPRSERTIEPAKSPVPPPDLVAPTSFGRYAVRGVLGRGGFGAVFLGHDEQLDRPVAIKVLHSDKQMPGGAADQFLQEARRAARLHHPNIVAVYDVGIQNNVVFVVSDFVQGASLQEWLKQHRPTWQEACRIAAAVADGLAHAHAQLTVHRDVKPANIMLRADLAPVLVDFGLGLDETEQPGRELGLIAGTPNYMSPEQVAGKGHRIDGRTDIYSLGVVLYEMLCGRKPFRAREISELMRQVREDEPQPPRQIARELPRDVERICLQAIAKRLADRYSTAADLADDLRRVLASPGSGIFPPIGASAEFAPVDSGKGSAAGTARPTPPIQPASQGQSGSASTLRKARAADRRQVTILCCCCDAFQSEPYFDSLDDEDRIEFLQAFQQACNESIKRFEGAILQSSAEGVIACFGYPVAYEDAVRRAARAALSILENCLALNPVLERKFQLTLTPRLGLHTGSAVAEVTEECMVSVAGDARNVAIRLGDLAEAGTIVCTEATERLVHGYFVCVELGRRKLKGLAQPLALHRLLSETGARSAMDVAAPIGLTPLTGRDHEVSLLKDRWERAMEGMGQIVLLIGEAGLGKSRLVYTLKQHLLEERAGPNQESVRFAASALASHPSSASAAIDASAPIVEWRCSPHHQNSGLYPVVDFFERFLSLSRQEAPPQKFNVLVGHLEELGLAQPELVPLFAALLSLPLDGRFAPLQLSPVRQRERMLEAVLLWLRAYSSRRTVLFIVEDLHWVDASTLEFLTMFVNTGLNDSVLTLFTFRPEFKTPWPAMAHQTNLALTRLTRRQVAEMMRRKTGIENIPDALIERTSGVPLFVEEFTRMLDESGKADQPIDGGPRPGALGLREIPATLQDLVMARLDRIEADKEVLQLCATLGREFSHEILAAVSTLDEPKLQAELAKLMQAELLYQKGRPPKCSYIFKHALLEDAAYHSIVKYKRQQFHKRVGEVLESRLPEMIETQPELLAHHFTEAGEARQAIDYWLKAGLRCRARSAETEAIGHLVKGLELLAALEETPQRDALELPFQAQLGTAYLATRGYAAPEAIPCFDRARLLCERVGAPPQLFAVLWGLWAWNIVRGDFRVTMQLATEALELARKQDDPGMTMEALFQIGSTMVYMGDFTGARDHLGQAVAEFDNRERTRFWSAQTGQDCGVSDRCYLALALWHLGHADQSLALCAEIDQLVGSLKHPFSSAYSLHHRGWLYVASRQTARAQAAAEEAIRISSEQGFALWHSTGIAYLGGALVQQGRAHEGLPLIQKGLAGYIATGADLAIPFYHCLLGECLLELGRLDDALKNLDEGLMIAERKGDLCCFAELHRVKGDLALARSPADEREAESHYLRAIDIARGQQGKSYELRAAVSLGRLRQRQGRAGEAREPLSEIYAWFKEGFDTPDLLAAKSLLDELR